MIVIFDINYVYLDLSSNICYFIKTFYLYHFVLWILSIKSAHDADSVQMILW